LSEARHTLLFVDDEADVLDILTRMFQRRYRVLTASSGTAALEILRRETVDVLVTDQRMPEMSGIEAAAVLQESMPGLPVILLSAYDDPGLQERAAAAGVSAYLIKGCSAQSLNAAVLGAARASTV